MGNFVSRRGGPREPCQLDQWSASYQGATAPRRMTMPRWHCAGGGTCLTESPVWCP